MTVWNLDVLRNNTVDASKKNQFRFQLRLYHAGDFQNDRLLCLTIEPLKSVKFQDDMLMPLPGAVRIGRYAETVRLHIHPPCDIVNVALVIIF